MTPRSIDSHCSTMREIFREFWGLGHVAYALGLMVWLLQRFNIHHPTETPSPPSSQALPDLALAPFTSGSRPRKRIRTTNRQCLDTRYSSGAGAGPTGQAGQGEHARTVLSGTGAYPDEFSESSDRSSSENEPPQPRGTAGTGAFPR